MPSEENLWQAVIAFQDYLFKTATGLPFRYKLKVGKNGEYGRFYSLYIYDVSGR